jgi:hypothetical protein
MGGNRIQDRAKVLGVYVFVMLVRCFDRWRSLWIDSLTFRVRVLAFLITYYLHVLRSTSLYRMKNGVTLIIFVWIICHVILTSSENRVRCIISSYSLSLVAKCVLHSTRSMRLFIKFSMSLAKPDIHPNLKASNDLLRLRWTQTSKSLVPSSLEHSTTSFLNVPLGSSTFELYKNFVQNRKSLIKLLYSTIST